jgi:hypothetical protein
MEQEIEAPMINLFAFLSEIQLYPEWMPNTDSAVFIGEVSQFRKCAHICSTMPWPFKHRESFLYGCGTFLKEENAIVMSMCSASKEKARWLGFPVKRNPKIAETEIHMQVVHIKALGSNKCKLTMMTNADPHLSGVPTSVINFIVRSGVGEFLKMIAEKSRCLPQIYFDKIKKRTDYYGEIEKLIAKLKLEEDLRVD